MRRLFLCLFGFFMCLLLVRGKVYTKCGLVEELTRKNFPRSYIGNCKLRYYIQDVSEQMQNPKTADGLHKNSPT